MGYGSNKIKVMSTLNMNSILAYFFAVLSVIDSVYHVLTARNSSNKEAVQVIMSIRSIICLAFVLIGAIFHTKICLNVVNAALFTIISLILTLLSVRFIPFHFFVISLTLHILLLFFGFLCLLGLLNIWYGLKDVEQDKLSIDGLTIKVLQIINGNMMAFGTLVSVLLTVVIGILIRNNDPVWSERQLMYMGFIGELFLRVLKCLILPLIFSSLVYAIGNMDAQLSGKIALRAVVYYMSTTVVAIITGIILVVSIQPGYRNKVAQDDIIPVEQKNITTIDTILDLARNLLPSNVFEATISYYSTDLKCNAKNCSNIPMDDWSVDSVMQPGSNILGVVMFAMMFGVTVTRIPEQKFMIQFFRGLNSMMMELTSLVIQVTPIAVAFLILPQIIKVKDLSIMIGAIGYYTLTVLLGIFIQSLITLPLIYYVATRKNPFTIIKHLSSALITAFGTSSSSATMPVTFTCLEDYAKLDKRIVRFCIPIGATINMDGTALYEAVAAIFIAQYREVPLNFVQMIIITITATAASIGAAGIPQAGLVTMIIVLNAVGLDPQDAALIVVIDWLLDRFRTTINVLGDSYGCAIVNHLSSKEIEKFDDMTTSVKEIDANSSINSITIN